MPYDSSGKPANSFGKAKLQDEIAASGKKPAANPRSREAGHQPDPDGSKEEMSQEDIKDVVSQHGPADELHHKKIGNEHHVTSMHGGFTHRSKHGSHGAAHAHMGHAMGTGGGEQPESKGSDSYTASDSKDAIPGLA